MKESATFDIEFVTEDETEAHISFDDGDLDIWSGDKYVTFCPADIPALISHLRRLREILAGWKRMTKMDTPEAKPAKAKK